MEDIIISGIQYDIFWESPDKNILFLENDVLPKINPSDIMIFPEMFTTGFTLNAKAYAEPMNGASVQWLCDMAAQYHCHMVGSMIIDTKNSAKKYVNRLIWARPDGNLSWYDKHHLFAIGDEHTIYSQGNDWLIMTVKGWRIRPFICYDLRFPAWTRNRFPFFDVSIFIANWPAKRINHWKSLLVARAIENQCYIMGLNRTGTDGNRIHYNGNSIIVDPQGDIMQEPFSSSQLIKQSLSYSNLSNWRNQFPVLQDADEISFSYS